MQRRKRGTGSVKLQKEYVRDVTGAYARGNDGKPIVKRSFFRGAWAGEDCYGITHRVNVQHDKERACHKLLDAELEKKLEEFERLQAKKWVDDRGDRMGQFRGNRGELNSSPFPDQPPTISEFIEKCYWDSNYASRQSHGTRSNLKGYVANHLDKEHTAGFLPVGAVRIHELTSKDLMAFERSKLTSLSSKSRLHILNFLRGVFTLAMSSECKDFTAVRANVPKEYKPLRHNELVVEVPKQALPLSVMHEIKTFADKKGDDTMVNLILFAMYGVRPNAAASLSWKDFDDELQVFEIFRQLKTENGERVWRPTKNRKGYLLPVLPEHLKTMRRTAEYSEFVCPASRKYRNQPIRHTAWGERFKIYAKEAGFPDAVLYDAKSSIATAARESNLDSDWIAKALAITPEMIGRHYHKATVEGIRGFFAQLLTSDILEATQTIGG